MQRWLSPEEEAVSTAEAPQNSEAGEEERDGRKCPSTRGKKRTVERMSQGTVPRWPLWTEGLPGSRAERFGFFKYPRAQQWIKGGNVVNSHHYYSAFKKEGDSDPCHNMAEP